MPSQLVNPAWTYLRGFLQPGKGRSISGPSEVADGLAATIDAEHWVPVPRYTGTVITPVPPLGDFAYVEIRGADKFVISDLFVQPFVSIMTITSANGGGANLPGNFTEANTSVQVFSGDAHQIQLGDGSRSTPPVGALLAGNEWRKIPDIEPGHIIQIGFSLADFAIQVSFMWAERRPLGIQ